LIIFRAISRALLTQGFGLEKTIPNMLPLYQSLDLIGHNGWDWSCDNGDPIYWDCDQEGVVLEVSLDPKAGLGVVLGTENKHKHIFWHLESVECQVGELLETGALIGYGDNTGMSTGPHLHRGLKETDGEYKTINWDNGYKGAINPAPYFKNVFVKDLMKELEETVSRLQRILDWLKKKLWMKNLTNGRRIN